jgi:hypothetical protein
MKLYISLSLPLLASPCVVLNIPRRILYFTYRPILYKKIMSWFLVHLEATLIGNQTDYKQQSFLISQYLCTWPLAELDYLPGIKLEECLFT